MIDFNHRNPSDKISALVDAALLKERAKQSARTYLGGSRLGQDCLRAMQYEYFNTPPDAGKGFSGQSLRIFDVGHALEAVAIDWLRSAGFDLRTEKADGQQFGFSVAKGRIQGHIDGVFVAGPDFMQYPALWEMKTMNAKHWKACLNQGVKTTKPIYYAQIQIYQAYMQLTDNPALFTAMNKDTQELYFELVDFNPAKAQEISDRGVMVLQACDEGTLLPRLHSDPSHFECKWCNWTDRCHGQGQ